MVLLLKRTGYIKTKEMEKAMLSVDRALFVPPSMRDAAYDDCALPIGYGQTISAPGVVAFMLEHLRVEKGMKVLEVGTGSGYNLALISKLVGAKGKAVSMEAVPELVEYAEKNIKKCDLPKNHGIIQGDGSCGCPEEAPFDRIIVTAGMPYIEDHPLLEQLKPDGVLIAPVGSRFFQDLIVYNKKTGEYRSVLPVIFVPLVGKNGFGSE